MPGPYVEMKISTSNGNNSNAKRVTGILASRMRGSITNLVECSFSQIARAALNDIIMAAIEKKRAERPIINFVGNRVRNLLSAYCDVMMPRNINTEVVAEKSDIASEIIKSINKGSFRNLGIPVFSSVPPGTVKAAENMMVTMRAATNVLALAISFIHFSPSFI